MSRSADPDGDRPSRACCSIVIQLAAVVHVRFMAELAVPTMKDARTHLAHKAEHAVDLDTGRSSA